jgi:hypothetical protein
VVNIEKRRLRAFEQNFFVLFFRFREKMRCFGDEWRKRSTSGAISRKSSSARSGG